jgi:hypothetical protein
MAFDARKTYYYLVCFATLLMIIIGAVQVVQNTLDLALPEEPYRPTTLDLAERLRPPPGATGEATERPSRAELEQMAEEEGARMLQQQRRRAIRGLLGSLTLVLIAAPVYVYHWRQVRRLD